MATPATGGAQKQGIASGSLLRDCRDLLGPPTRPINVNSFLDACDAVHIKQALVLEQLTARLESSSAQSQIEERCSVQAYAEETSEIHGDVACRSELEKIAALKQIASTNRIIKGKSLDTNSDARATPGSPNSQGSGTPEAAADGDDAATASLVFVPERISGLVDDYKQGTKSLRILKPSTSSVHYIRKSRTTDYNSLLAPQLESRDSSQVREQDNSDGLDQIVYTFKFQPTARASTVNTDTNAPQTIPFPPRQQVMHVLGSTTLAEVRDACKLGGDNVPAVEDDEDSESSSESSDSDEDPGHPPPRQRRRLDSKRLAARELGLPNWTKERRVTGCAFAIEGKLYADGRDNATDYADMILKLIDSVTPWPEPAKKTTTDARVRRYAPPASWSLIEGSLPLKEPQGSVALPFDPHNVYSKAKRSIQEARIGELDLRVGQPYWYIHQGNCEHVWTVEEIRHLHPLDPSATDFDSQRAPYPRTTFLSRGLAIVKCRLCELSPGEIITLNDDLAGDTPALLCRTCYEHLHVDANGNDDDLVKIPVIFES